MKRTVAILCSGQGGQHARMFSLVADRPEAQDIFRDAADLLGADPRDYVRHATDDALYANRSGQILCCTLALAIGTLVARTGARLVCAGYSVGELAAWGIAGCLSPRQVLHLAAQRAELMDRASPPHAGLAGIAGLPDARLHTLLARTGTVIAIRNAPDAAVIGGLRPNLEQAVAEALEMGATTARILRVAVPSHTPLLHDAVAPLRDMLHALHLANPSPTVRLLSGLDGEPIFRIADGCDRLAAQVGTTVRWDACMQACAEADAGCVLETGPGSALSRMARTALPDLPVHAAEDFHSVDGLLRWVGQAAR
ncbi:acyltransferase domain-containing protein [Gluconacetobacter takamatsuzukensis]|uniref:Acyltransferase domain-containing protein n=1 Tax=Gluconacetobacter takamatsuzukensis TaxID=1286190 RepID=A0A7W4KFB4_9PROT|nr:acyltransferase domain-containing protein [Gluconacetobacter takamatsuzukensis]MBB2205876.1 acyltransferase domain-containing protein [Gluconacetobacter takamatsuzukensis]